MKLVGLLALLSMLLISIGAVSAIQPTSVSLTAIPSNVPQFLFNVSFYNNQTSNVNLSFNAGLASIENSGFFSHIGIKPSSFTLAPGQSENVLFSFVPNGKVSSYPVIINISYTLNGLQKYFIMSAPVVPIQNLISKVSVPSLVEPTSQLDFNVSLLNSLGQGAVVPLTYTIIKDSNGALLIEHTGNVILSSLGIDVFPFALPANPSLPSGTYTINASTNYGGYLSEGQVTFNVANYTSTSQVTSSNINMFGGTASVAITNNGNVNIPQSNLTLAVSKFDSIFLTAEYSSLGTVQLNNGIVSTTLAALAPGQTITLSYTVSYLPIYIIIVIVIAAIAIFLYLNRKVVVSKEVVEHKLVGGFVDVKIALKVRNVSKKVLKDLTVVDLVPPNALKVSAVGPKEGKISKATNGLNVTWKEVELQPNDEILLMYEIKSKLGIVGRIELRPATVWFKVDGKESSKRSNYLLLNIK